MRPGGRTREPLLDRFAVDIQHCVQMSIERYFKSDQFFAVSARPEAQITAAMINIHE